MAGWETMMTQAMEAMMAQAVSLGAAVCVGAALALTAAVVLAGMMRRQQQGR